MSAQRWRRIGKLSGPANVLDDRYEVGRFGSIWIVTDLKTAERVGGPRRTMAAARQVAEFVAGQQQ